MGSDVLEQRKPASEAQSYTYSCTARLQHHISYRLSSGRSMSLVVHIGFAHHKSWCTPARASAHASAIAKKFCSYRIVYRGRESKPVLTYISLFSVHGRRLTGRVTARTRGDSRNRTRRALYQSSVRARHDSHRDVGCRCDCACQALALACGYITV